MRRAVRLFGTCANARSGAVLALTASLALPAVGPASSFLVALGLPSMLAWPMTAGTVLVRFAVGSWLVVREFSVPTPRVRERSPRIRRFSHPTCPAVRAF